jgi:hypothetical protein
MTSHAPRAAAPHRPHRWPSTAPAPAAAGSPSAMQPAARVAHHARGGSSGTAPQRCPAGLRRCRCQLAAGHPTGHIYIHASSAPDPKAG